MIPCICMLLLPLLLFVRRSFANEPILLFPQSTVFQFTIGVSVPIAMDKKGGVVFSFGYQFNYVLPWNVSQFEPMVIQGRTAQMPQLNLKIVYTTLEELLEKYGWNNGRACLLRAICELAEIPMVRNSVVEEIIHLLLTPSENWTNRTMSWMESEWSEEERLYGEAELLGRRSRGYGKCGLAYADCDTSPLRSFTEIAFR